MGFSNEYCFELLTSRDRTSKEHFICHLLSEAFAFAIYCRIDHTLSRDTHPDSFPGSMVNGEGSPPMESNVADDMRLSRPIAVDA